MIKLGTPDTILRKELMEPLSLGSQPTKLPLLKEGHELVCDVIRVPGVDSLNYTVVVENEEDMKQLTRSYLMGMINQLEWYSAPDIGFITLPQVQKSEENVPSELGMK